MTDEIDTVERRRRQRFLATRHGERCFWAMIDGRRVPLCDLSVEGFAMPSDSPPPADRSFEFVLVREGVPDEIRGRARVVNYLHGVSGGQAGCLFEQIEGDGRSRLVEWLTTHVLMSACVPISEQDADAIVSGPSLI